MLKLDWVFDFRGQVFLRNYSLPGNLKFGGRGVLKKLFWERPGYKNFLLGMPKKAVCLTTEPKRGLRVGQ